MTYYDESYFEWQKSTGEFGSTVDRYKFEKYIRTIDYVLDFGCGGGFMLKSLNCAAKIGVEVNDSARQFALTQGISAVKDSNQILDEWADVIISDNALEHTLAPSKVIS